MAKNEDVSSPSKEIIDCASFRDKCCATAERKLFVDLDETVAWNPGKKKKWENIGKEIFSLAERKKRGGGKL